MPNPLYSQHVRQILGEIASSGGPATIAFDDLVSRVFAGLPPGSTRGEELVDAAVMEEARHISIRRVSGKLMVSLTPSGIQFFNDLHVVNEATTRNVSKKEDAIYEYSQLAQRILPMIDILRASNPVDLRLLGVDRLDEVLRDHYETLIYLEESNNTLSERLSDVTEEVRQLEMQAQLTASDLEDD